MMPNVQFYSTTEPLEIQGGPSPLKYNDEDADADEDDDGLNVALTYDLPKRLVGKVNRRAIKNVSTELLKNMDYREVRAGSIRIAFVFCGPHRGALGVITDDNGRWVKINTFDKIQIGESGAMVLGEWDGVIEWGDLFGPSPKIVNKSQLVPINYRLL